MLSVWNMMFGSRSSRTEPLASCLICLDVMPPPMSNSTSREAQASDSWQLRCKHTYHVGCLFMLVQSKVNDRDVPVRCCVAACQSKIRPRHVAAVLPRSLYERYSALDRAKTIEARGMYCPYQSCSRILNKPNAAVARMTCGFCNMHICARCRVLWHEGMTCDEYKCIVNAGGIPELAQLEALSKAKGWKHCPKCHTLVESLGGCKFMTCKCGAHFCYGCGAAYITNIPNASNCHGQV
ncbi:hypothetical protein ACHHYP_20065 [Achlya hypogyna]|uniref:RBR-type E3 ubiquitin transferase n=1 Tax=Achlya hypogyna TaxID=1202772 RepID=A0A1V9ZTH9_ACHHY|nr:hypothetical protein ACHHYP_20065 [Achlya hypogyna]